MNSVSDIKLIRTDTTLDLSQKAEKRCPKLFAIARVVLSCYPRDMVARILSLPEVSFSQLVPPPTPPKGTERSRAPEVFRYRKILLARFKNGPLTKNKLQVNMKVSPLTHKKCGKIDNIETRQVLTIAIRCCLQLSLHLEGSLARVTCVKL